MDEQSKSVIEFLNILQNTHGESHLILLNALIKRGAIGKDRFVTLSGKPCYYNNEEFTGAVILGLQVKTKISDPADILEYSTTIWWNNNKWIIETEATHYPYDEDSGNVLRSLPNKTTQSLIECIEIVKSDVLKLSEWDDLYENVNLKS